MFGRFESFVSSSSTDPLAPRFFLPLFVIYTRLIIISCKILPSFLTVPGTFRKGALRFKIHVRTVCTHACFSEHCMSAKGVDDAAGTNNL